MKAIVQLDFNRDLPTGNAQNAWLSDDNGPLVGHFDVFDLADVVKPTPGRSHKMLPCQGEYKITLLLSQSQAIYGGKVVNIKPDALVFSPPSASFQCLPHSTGQSGAYCVFTAEFLQPSMNKIMVDELPIFKAKEHPVFQLTDSESSKVQMVFRNMQEEIISDYAYKYDLLRTYVLELIHLGQKLQPITAMYPPHDASERVAHSFIKLLEAQFPLDSPQQQLRLRTPKDYAEELAVHVNYLNRVLKETTGRTTTDLISSRIVQEAKVLLKYTDWTIAQIADSLGFTDVTHFSHFFKRQVAVPPGALRKKVTV